MSKMVCPICGEGVVEGRPVRDLPATHPHVGKERMQYRHKDGEPLCAEMTTGGYAPAMPIEG